ncbi:hypothetical protein FB451DRAFT_1191141 [Mycena latifolia]|nr:hypothetical protein FB451DRAFT_1191141 [Mycena latifolia]
MAPKRMAVPGPDRQAYDKMNVAGKARIEQLEYELAAAKALADKQAEMTRLLQEEYTTLAEEFHECQVHENQLGRPVHERPRAAYERTAATMVESQNQLMTQNRAIERLTRDVVDRTNGEPGIESSDRAPSGPSSHTPRKGAGRQVPSTPERQCHVADSSRSSTSSRPTRAFLCETPGRSPCTAEETIYKALDLQGAPELDRKVEGDGQAQETVDEAQIHAEPVAPDDENYWNRELREKTYKVFRENKQFDFMSHAPVSPEEMKASIIPKENDWRWDSLKGRTKSGRVFKPRALPGGGLETAEQAIARAVAYLAKRNDSHKSTSAKTRKFETRLLTITVTIEIKTEGFDTQHRGPTKVVRKPTNGIGRSPAPKGLPECLYNTEWLKELNQFEVEALEVSEEAFGCSLRRQAGWSRKALSRSDSDKVYSSKHVDSTQKHDLRERLNGTMYALQASRVRIASVEKDGNGTMYALQASRVRIASVEENVEKAFIGRPAPKKHRVLTRERSDGTGRCLRFGYRAFASALQKVYLRRCLLGDLHPRNTEF